MLVGLINVNLEEAVEAIERLLFTLVLGLETSSATNLLEGTVLLKVELMTILVFEAFFGAIPLFRQNIFLECRQRYHLRVWRN